MDGVSYSYRNGPPVIRDVSFTIDTPEFLCIVGPNGVGKSTLVKCMTGALKPTEGRVLVHDKNVKEYPLKELSKYIAYVPVTAGDYNAMTVLDTVMVGRFNKQSWRTTPADVRKSYKALAAMGIEDLAMRKSNELSAGQQQRVALSRGIVQEAEVLILDEPTSNLDPRHQVYVTSFLKDLSRKSGLSVVMISHDLNLASKYADRLIVMEPPGVVRSIGRPSDVITREVIREVYSVDCTIVDDNGSPHVILQDVLF